MKKIYSKIAIFAALLAFIDQISKAWVISQRSELLAQDQSQFFMITYSENPGIAFGIPIPQTLLLVLTILLIILIIHISHKELNIKNRLSQVSITLILGGALGNLIDRFTLGYVIDFISIWKYPTFNLADAFIFIGVLMILVFYGRISRSKS